MNIVKVYFYAIGNETNIFNNKDKFLINFATNLDIHTCDLKYVL